MTLNLLPHRFICDTFNSLKSQHQGALYRKLFDYFEKNWLNSSVWGPKTWSVFGLPIRTNNPVESYHARLKRLAKKPNLNLYLLIELLWVESQRVPMNCFLLTTDKFGDYQSKQNSSFTSTLMCYWKNFNDGFYSSVEALHVEVTELVKNKYQFNFNRNIAN